MLIRTSDIRTDWYWFGMQNARQFFFIVRSFTDILHVFCFVTDSTTRNESPGDHTHQTRPGTGTQAVQNVTGAFLINFSDITCFSIKNVGILDTPLFLVSDKVHEAQDLSK